MRSYLIEDFQPGDLDRFKKNLADRGWQGPVEGFYWLPLDPALQSNEQCSHEQDCGPFAMGLEVEEEWLKLELLVRGRAKLRCSCVAFATPEQREYAIRTLDTLLRELDIQVW